MVKANKKQTMCTINHKPIKKGSIVRNAGFGSCLLKVVSIKGNTLILKSFGNTNYGKFTLSTRARKIICYFNPCPHMPHNCWAVNKSKCYSKGANTYWLYQHVTINFKG